MYQHNVPYRGTPEDRVYRRELRPRRTRSEDPRSSRQFIDETLSEIRRKPSTQNSADMRISYEEIDQLLNNIRRSRSQSQMNEEPSNEKPCRPDVTKTCDKSYHPPPPQTIPPPLPTESTPFGDVLSSNWSPMTRRSRTPRRLKTTSLYCQGSTQTSKEPLNMPEKKFWQIGHCLSGRDEGSSPPFSVSKSKQTFETILNTDQKSSDDLRRLAPEAISETSKRDISPGNGSPIDGKTKIPTCMYDHRTQRLSGTSLEHHDVPADKNFNEHEGNCVGGSASPNTHNHTNKQFCMTDMRLGGTNNNAHRIKCTTGTECEEKSQSSHQVTGLGDPQLETHPDLTKVSDSESHDQNKPSNISPQRSKRSNKNCPKKGDVLWNDNPVYQPTNTGSSSKLKDNKDQTKTCYADPNQKKFFNVGDIHEMDIITSFKKEVDDKELHQDGARSAEIPDLENYAKNTTNTDKNVIAKNFQKECADIEQDAFKLVNDLKVRLADMTLELEKVKTAADQLNNGIHEMSSEDEESVYEQNEEPLSFYTVEEPEEIPNEDYSGNRASSLIIEDMSREETATSPVFNRSEHVLPKPIVIQRIHPPFIASADNKAPIHSVGFKSKPQTTQTFADDGHFLTSNFRYLQEVN